MKTAKVMFKALSIFVLYAIISCAGGPAAKEASKWPPVSPSDSLITDFQPGVSASFHGYEQITESKYSSAYVGRASFVRKGDFMLRDNIFSIEKPIAAYVESQFEVLYFNDSITQVRIDSTKGDSLAINLDNFQYAFVYSGAKIRCGDKTYLLQADGWYLGDERVHAFHQEEELQDAEE